MRLQYFAETDTLYVAFRDEAGVDSQEVAPGVVLDLDARGEAVGFEVEDASRRVDFSTLEHGSLPTGEVSTP